MPVRHAELMATIAKTLHRPLWPLKIPAPVLRAILSELAELFVAGQRVLPERLRALDFRFQYPTIDVALAQALERPPRVSGSPRAPR